VGIATAVLDRIIGINAFNHRRRSIKIETRNSQASMKQRASCQRESPLRSDGVKLYATARNTKALKNGRPRGGLENSSVRAGAGGLFRFARYITINAEMNPSQGIRHTVPEPQEKLADRSRIWAAVFCTRQARPPKADRQRCLPANHLCTDANDLRSLNRDYTFGVSKRRKPVGDFAV